MKHMIYKGPDSGLLFFSNTKRTCNTHTYIKHVCNQVWSLNHVNLVGISKMIDSNQLPFLFSLLFQFIGFLEPYTEEGFSKGWKH